MIQKSLELSPYNSEMSDSFTFFIYHHTHTIQSDSENLTSRVILAIEIGGDDDEEEEEDGDDRKNINSRMDKMGRFLN